MTRSGRLAVHACHGLKFMYCRVLFFIGDGYGCCKGIPVSTSTNLKVKITIKINPCQKFDAIHLKFCIKIIIMVSWDTVQLTPLVLVLSLQP